MGSRQTNAKRVTLTTENTERTEKDVGTLAFVLAVRP